MGAVAISVQGLGKQYRLGPRAAARRSLQETLNGWLTAPLRSFRELGGRAARGEEFWALQDVSFAVEPGEVVGIIGRNGAGKSTLLKILSRITEPTTGRAEIRGRVGSLLEVGTGFHPELTGRENIYLNGAILGMPRAEIRRKFDEIVAFAEIERFLDTPVKRYSSGMYVRLAFAVAAHLDPEILLVDEVLAVGDADFQRKCLGKMGGVSRGGRTILLVSHSPGAIQHLCRRTLLLDQGYLVRDGPTERVLAEYLAERATSAIPLAERSDRQGSGDVRFTGVRLQNRHGRDLRGFHSGQEAHLVLTYENRRGRPLRHVLIALGLDNHLGTRLLLLSNELSTGQRCTLPPGAGQAAFGLPRLPLLEGRYSMTLFCSVAHEIADWVQQAASFDVAQGDFFGTGRMLSRGEALLAIEHHSALRPDDGACSAPQPASPAEATWHGRG